MGTRTWCLEAEAWSLLSDRLICLVYNKIYAICYLDPGLSFQILGKSANKGLASFRYISLWCQVSIASGNSPGRIAADRDYSRSGKSSCYHTFSQSPSVSVSAALQMLWALKSFSDWSETILGFHNATLGATGLHCLGYIYHHSPGYSKT